jgi:dolichyl-phosphate beta-glucosyltransferase
MITGSNGLSSSGGSTLVSTISIVIPAYNESARLGRTLDRVLNFVHRQGWRAEIIVVDDGSSDETAELVQTYAQRNPSVRLLSNPGNRGKGYSVRNGILHASGEFILFTDADLSSPIEEAAKLFQALENGSDIAIGSRWVRPELQTQRQSVTRQILGRVFNGILRFFLRLKFNDTQCGFKALRQHSAKAIFPLQRIEGWGFDPEILFLAQKMGLAIAEVPVLWAHDDRTRIHPLADGAKMLAEMIRIRWYDLTGKYASDAAVQPSVVRAIEH